MKSGRYVCHSATVRSSRRRPLKHGALKVIFYVSQEVQNDPTRGLYKTWYGRTLLVLIGIAFSCAFIVQLQLALTRKMHRDIKPTVRPMNSALSAHLPQEGPSVASKKLESTPHAPARRALQRP